MDNIVERIFLSAFGADELQITDISLYYTDLVKKEIIHRAEKSKKMPFIAKYFQSCGVDIGYWSEVLNIYQSRNSMILEKTQELFYQFHLDGVKKVFLYENFGALLLSNTDFSQFSSGDIDIFADLSEKEKLTQSLNKLGFYDIINHFSLVSSIFINNDLNLDFKINIMWQPLSRNKLPFYIDINNTIKWDNLIKYRETEIKIPNPTALMYLCLLHISVHCYVREPDLRLYKDIEFLSGMVIDWREIYELARYDKKIVRVSTVLYISKTFLKIDVPIIDNFDRRKNIKSINKLIRYIVDSKTGKLKFNPSKFDILKIEIYSDHSSFVYGIFKFLFPGIKWVRQVYPNKLNLTLISYIKHFVALLK